MVFGLWAWLPAQAVGAEEAGAGGAAPNPAENRDDAPVDMDAWWRDWRSLLETQLENGTPLFEEESAADAGDLDLRRMTELGKRVALLREARAYWDAQRAHIDRLGPLDQAEALGRSESGDELSPKAAALTEWRRLAARYVSILDRIAAASALAKEAYEDHVAAVAADDARRETTPAPAAQEPTADTRKTMVFRRSDDALTAYEEHTRLLSDLEAQHRSLIEQRDRAERDAAFRGRLVEAAKMAMPALSTWPSLLEDQDRIASRLTTVFAADGMERPLREMARIARRTLPEAKDFVEKFETDRMRLEREIDFEASTVQDKTARAQAVRDRIEKERRAWLRVIAATAWEVLITRGVLILVIVIAAFVFARSLKPLGRRIIRRAARNADQGHAVSAEQRAKTLVGVLQGVAKGLVVFLAILAILQVMGVNIAPLLGVFAILGLAVSFGSQNLVKDVVNGFFILLEGQLSVGHIVKLAEVDGVVESISLRRTVLRNVEGVVHSVPNSSIGVVSNLTFQWARVIVHVGVTYDAPLRKVRDILNRVGGDLYQDADWRAKLLEAPSVAGIEELGDSSIVFRVWGMVRPAQQWDVKRELHLRIKEAFDAEGIEIPFPQRTVWIRSEAD